MKRDGGNTEHLRTTLEPSIAKTPVTFSSEARHNREDELTHVSTSELPFPRKNISSSIHLGKQGRTVFKSQVQFN